jgi:hypothetical protein
MYVEFIISCIEYVLLISIWKGRHDKVYLNKKWNWVIFEHVIKYKNEKYNLVEKNDDKV